MSATVAGAVPVKLRSAAEARESGVATVGGKAAGLARLVGVGVRVPEWEVVPAGALDDRLRELDAAPPLRLALRRFEGGETSAEQVAAALPDDLGPGPELRDAIAVALARIGPGPYAVRSSAPDEDGARLSFAGQFDSVLGPRDVDEVCAAIGRCWRSALGARALEYRRRTGTLADATRLAVVVQRLVQGEVSGVLFTRDPVGGDPTLMRASAIWGLGEALVSGDADADEYLFTRDGAERGVTVARKRARMRVALGRVVSEEIAEDEREARTLTAADLASLAAAGRAIVAAEGGERDVEWTIAGGALYVLQARPITAAAPVDGGHRVVWDNSNIQESYSGVTTPLTFSFASAAYASVYAQTMRAVGIRSEVVAAHAPLLRGLLGLVRGRVYNLENWYRGLLLLPAFGRNKADMERMMGVEEPVDFVEDDAPTGAARLRRAPAMAGTLARLLHRFSRLRRDVPRFLAEFDAAIVALDRRGAGARSLGGLMRDLDHLRERCLERWSTPIVNDFYVMMATGRLRRIVERAAPGSADLLLPALLAGAGGEASAGPATLFLRMASVARADAPLASLLGAGDAAAALGRAAAASPELAALLDELYERWGDRCIGELKLESRALRDDPAFVVGVLRSYLAGSAPDAAAVAARVERARADAAERVERGLGILARRRFRRAAAAARRGVRDREAMRLARTRMFGAHRDVYRAIGARLQAAGRLDCADDVFYLTTDEIRAWWDGTSASADLAPIARARRAEFAAYEAEPAPPNRVVTTGAPHEHRFQSETAVVASGRVLRGLGCSPGVAVGRVRVVTSAAGDLSLAGLVLVAPRTDPGWAPLFPGAAAIVVERGSLLSHSAVLARELGLPAVVGIPGVVSTLRDGERVRVDGAAGTVERLDEP